MEDDNGFGFVDSTGISVTTKKTGLVFRRAMEELPADWDMLYFMAYEIEPSTRYSEHLAKLKKGNITNAVAINHTLYDRLCEQLERIYDPTKEPVSAIDGEYNSLHATINAYGIVPSIAYQQIGPSSIVSETVQKLRQEQSIESELTLLYGDALPEDCTELLTFDVQNAFENEPCNVSGDRGFLDLNLLVAKKFKQYIDAQKFLGTPHNLTTCKQKDILVEAYSVSKGEAKYLMHSSPHTMEEAVNFFEGILERNIDLLVSTIKSSETPERIISYLPEGVDAITTPSGWTIKVATPQLVEESTISRAKLYETALTAIHENGEERTLCYLHYDGWQRFLPIPDRELMQKLLDRLQDQKMPFAVGSRWDYSRHSCVVLSHYLRRQEGPVNILQTILDFRLQFHGFMEHDAAFGDVFRLYDEYVKGLPQKGSN